MEHSQGEATADEEFILNTKTPEHCIFTHQDYTRKQANDVF